MKQLVYKKIELTGAPRARHLLHSHPLFLEMEFAEFAAKVLPRARLRVFNQGRVVFKVGLREDLRNTLRLSVICLI